MGASMALMCCIVLGCRAGVEEIEEFDRILECSDQDMLQKVAGILQGALSDQEGGVKKQPDEPGATATAWAGAGAGEGKIETDIVHDQPQMKITIPGEL